MCFDCFFFAFCLVHFRSVHSYFISFLRSAAYDSSHGCVQNEWLLRLKLRIRFVDEQPLMLTWVRCPNGLTKVMTAEGKDLVAVFLTRASQPSLCGPGMNINVLLHP
jgi:hypothetical protein